ncbi:MAG: pyruvate kinase, partial [Pseudomonadota bacterium]
LRFHLVKVKSDAGVIAKIEKPEALRELKEIMEISDAVMVARGDLGVEIELERIPAVQKEILNLGRVTKTPVIVATQMLETMIHNPLPTRAEVTDVYQAVRDGADAVMLSGETAVGEHPVETVKMMKKIIHESEKTIDHKMRTIELSSDTDKAIASISGVLTDKINAKFICCFTSSGWTAKLISKTNMKHPITAFVQTKKLARKINMYRGVTAVNMNTRISNIDNMLEALNKKLKAEKLAEKGNKVVVVAGSPFGYPGTTNLMKVHTVY